MSKLTTKVDVKALSKGTGHAENTDQKDKNVDEEGDKKDKK